MAIRIRDNILSMPATVESQKLDKEPSKPLKTQGFDRAAYQREYMRTYMKTRRDKLKAKKDQ